MNIHLLQWALYLFLTGLVLSFPLAATFYSKSTWTNIFVNIRKLKSAHLDYFTQAFAMGLVFLIELSLKTELKNYIVIPLMFGSFCNPLILLIESTPIHHSGFGKIFYQILQATSPASLIFSWFAIAFIFLPFFLFFFLLLFVLIGLSLMWKYKGFTKHSKTFGFK